MANSDIVNNTNINYLLWSKAYLPAADKKSEKGKIEPGVKKPDGKVDRDEWEAYLASRDITSKSLFDLYKLDVVDGTFLSKNLEPQDAYYTDYRKFASFMRDQIKNNPKLVPGLPPGEITDDPQKLLDLAAKYNKSQVVNSWLGEAARFGNVPDSFRAKAAEHLMKDIEADMKSKEFDADEALVADSQALFDMLQSPEAAQTWSKLILHRLADLAEDFSAQSRTDDEGNAFCKLFFWALSSADITSDMRLGYLNKFLAHKNYYGKGFGYIRYLTASNKMAEKDILDICALIQTRILGSEKEEAGMKYVELIDALAFAYINPRVSDAGAKTVLGILNTVARTPFKDGVNDRYREKHIGLAFAVMTSAKFRPLADPAIRRAQTMELLKAFSSSGNGISGEAVRDMFFNMLWFVKREDFTSLFAEAVNYVFSRPSYNDRYSAQEFAVLINQFHDWDNETGVAPATRKDLYRTEIVNKLSTRSKIIIMALAGPDLYTSTFEKLFGSLGLNSRTIDAFLKELDSVAKGYGNIRQKGADDFGYEPSWSKSIVTELILTLGSFGKLTSLFVLKPEYFLDQLRKALSDRENMSNSTMLRNTYLLAGVVYEIFTDPAMAQVKVKMEKILLEAVKNDDTGCIAYLIKLNQKEFSAANRAEVNAICAGLPEVLNPMIPPGIVKSGAIRSNLFFYQEEHYRLIQSMFKGRGYSIRRVDAKTVEMTKTVNGIKLVVVATTDCSSENIEKALKGDEFQVVAHRGHSYQLTDTFSSSIEDPGRGKLLILGSCGGFRAIPDLMHTYYGNYFISTEGIGRGEINNNILYHLLDFMAKNKQGISMNSVSFEEAKKYVEGKITNFEDADIVFPDEKSILLFDFLEKYKLMHPNP